MSQPLPPHDFANLKPEEIAMVRRAVAEHAPSIQSFAALLYKLVKSANEDSDQVLHRDIIHLADMIQLADPVFDQLQKREDERQHDATVQTMAPARPPLKRGRGMVKVVTSQRFPKETPADVFDSMPTPGKLKRPAYIQEDDPDDDIPF